MSLMKILTKKGPRIDPGGAPKSILHHWLNLLLTLPSKHVLTSDFE